jgi:alkanesulfonate monooxygenase SsuD/methylene tetrahydromethanopterin reductase-like flavin-dependent oxidoreductase (luciferase family)
VRIGMTLYIQRYNDWERYNAAEDDPAHAQPIDPDADAKRYREELDQALLAEDQGFDSIWTVEHHISPYTMIPNPMQLLTYFAGATSRIDVGTMVVVLPWHHPLRVAEDMTMLQNVLNGRRAFIGFGRGAARREFRELGFDMNQSKERFAESIQIVKKALTEEKFSFEGQHYKMEDITMRPRPRDPQQLINDFHFSWGSPQSAPVGASFGLRPMVIPQKSWEEYHADLSAFAKARAEAGYEPTRPRIHMNMFCAETHEKAEEGANKWIRQYADSARRNYEIDSDHFKDIKGYEHYATQAAAMDKVQNAREAMGDLYVANHIWGTPDECLAKLQKLAGDFHPEEFMLVCRYGEMPADVARDSIDLFAREVLPGAHEIEPGEPLS